MNDQLVNRNSALETPLQREPLRPECETEECPQTLDIEPYFRECGYYDSCPFDLPLDGSDCPGCHAREQYVDDVPPTNCVTRQ